MRWLLVNQFSPPRRKALFLVDLGFDMDGICQPPLASGLGGGMLARNAIDVLEDQLQTQWPAIRAARLAAHEKRAELENALAPPVVEDTSLVIFGSLAREEYTSGSDIDWTLLVDGQAHPGHLDVSLDIKSRLDGLEGKQPGREGTFGGLAFSHDILNHIGGGDDTNRNLTQRILLLLESDVLGKSEAYTRVLREVLKRYINEDYGIAHRTGPSQVPRFLQNDVARYWRTVAVDFAYKRRQRRGDGWALRAAKLRLSRKLTYVSGLLACFSCDTDPALAGVAQTHPQDLTHRLVEHLAGFVARTPLDIIASEIGRHDQLHEAVRNLFGAYNAFLAILDDPEKRDQLDKLPPGAAATDLLYKEVRTLGHKFQSALDVIFFEANGTEIPRLTKIYGTF